MGPYIDISYRIVSYRQDAFRNSFVRLGKFRKHYRRPNDLVRKLWKSLSLQRNFLPWLSVF